MTQEKWQNIISLIKDQFPIEDEGKEEFDPPQATQAGGQGDAPNGQVEFIIFQGPLGRMKLEYTTKPVILDKKTIGSKRIGSEATVQYVYSDTEFSHAFKAYKWDADDEEWVEMAKESLGGFSV
ncbi:hypothetical protein COU01_03050 [Candidatus Falkowbacteria bacterium CG10_big_fil_rev_8_21_14_0_10_44_15]|uniref:Uncharacterized protein n=1 Tax=Candidatus Falkowbacteria bacterium CG10_big_fil_rev_8_21_14_0_10_44_15 TaxID=1974569 RepID=A0A2H0UZB9_9BACT|nr:MAG: hypothetical protein COU01_03050 [Candidatus Falkowbacteria bacterium CG10_big_fil_rev_8_21_14_0_10_44_15]